MAKIGAHPALQVSVSVVSHGQMAWVRPLMQDLERFCSGLAFELILTLNIPENPEFEPGDFSYPIQMVCNPRALGFSANHNQAFARARGIYFCILNPDIRLRGDPFAPLLAALPAHGWGVAAPRVVDARGCTQDSARRFPTPASLLARALRRRHGPDDPLQGQRVEVDWVAGMFMLLPAEVFARLGGLDEGYFLYYEDVDLCARVHLAGLPVLVCPEVSVVHLAQRSSHRNLRYLRWHLGSLWRYLHSGPYRKLRSLGRV